MRRPLLIGLVLPLGISLVLALLYPAVSVPRGAAHGAVPSGATATRLADGRWLLLGGAQTPSSATLWDQETNGIIPIGRLHRPRAWHTATLLPDGTVVVLGGVDPRGRVVEGAELFNPDTLQFEWVPAGAVSPRAFHSATVLTDGRVLIAGGISEAGDPVTALELWNPRLRTSQGAAPALSDGRFGHTATLLANGVVVLWGGFDAAGVALHNGEVFDPESGTLVPIDVFLPPLGMGPPLVEVSLPHAGATDVPVDIVLALRFSEPLLADTVNVATVTLFGPDGAVAARLVPAEGGMLLFVSPLAPLRAGADYTLTLSSLLDGEGLALPLTEVSFTTAGRAGGDALRSSENAGFGSPAASADKESPSLDPRDAPPGGVWVPSAGNLKGDWRINLPPSPWQSLPPLQARHGETALAGQVLRVDGWPLAKVFLQIGKRQVKTDETGRFLLPKLEAGRHMLVVDARPASTRSTTYGLFMVAVDIVASETTVMPQTIWMPVIDIAHAIKIPSPTTAEVVATTPLIPGLEVRIPAGTILRQFDGRAATTITISPIPIDRAPFPLPPDAAFPVYFTIQPGGTRIEAADGSERPGMRIVYPNYSDIPAGSEVQTYSYDAGGQGWFVLGKSRVVPGGASVVPEPGVAYHVFTCSGDLPDAQAGAVAGGVTDGEPVDLATGLFVLRKTDLFLPDVIPLALTRTYEPSDSISRSFGIGSRHAYDLFLAAAAGDDCQYVDLLLPNGARIRYVRQSGACTNAVMFPHTSSPTEFYGSTLERINVFSFWRITLRDGTVYDFSGKPPKIDRIQDRYGNTVRIFRDSSHGGRITKILSPNGRWIEFSYMDPGYNRITEARDNIGRVVRYAYNDIGRLRTVTDAKGGVTAYEYAPDGCRGMRTITDARNLLFLTNEYRTDRCAVARQTVAGYPPYTFTYVEATSCCGLPPDYHLYLCGTCTLNVGACHCVQRAYYQQVLVTDPGGTVRRITFDPDTGYPLSDTHADGTSDAQTVTYNDGISNKGLVSSVTDALGRRTELTYDETGLPRSITRLAGTPNALTTTFTYEPRFKQLETIVEPPTRLTQFHYESGRLIGITDATERLTGISLTPQGQLRTIADADGTTQFAYEGADLVQIIDPGGNTTTRFVDAGGRVRSVTDPLGHRTLYEYDPLNNLTRIVDPLGGIVEFDYDPNGNLQVVRDRRRSLMRETFYFYDAMDRLSQRMDPLVRSEAFPEYDFAGNLRKYIDRRGKVTRFGYDRLGRLTFAGFGATGPDTSPTYESTIDYEYDGGNRPNKIVDKLNGTIVGRIIRGYDELDHLKCESKGTDPPCSASQPDAVTYTYESATGRRASMTVSGQPVVTYGYDDADRLRQVMQGTASVTITPDAVGRRGTVLLPNSFATVYGYDSNSRVSSIQYMNGATVLGGLIYTRAATGNVIQVGGEWARTGLPAETTASYDSADQLASWNGILLPPDRYDANGNLQNDGTRTYAWDARNQLASVSGSPSLTFQYDAFGRRTQRAPSGFFSSTFLYDGLNPVVRTTGSTTTRLLTGLNIDDLFVATEGSTTKPFLVDSLGSTLTLADPNANPPTQPTYTYEPFGKSSLAGGTPFQFTGRENEGIGLYYYRARYYSPTFGRFISEDPIEFEGGDLNLYVYGFDNPISYSDPTGEFAWILLVPPAIGFGTGVLTDLATQLAMNGGNLRCVSVGEALGSGALGALAASVGPEGFIFGNRFASGGVTGILNQGYKRIGWSRLAPGVYEFGRRIGVDHFPWRYVPKIYGSGNWPFGLGGGGIGGLIGRGIGAGFGGRASCGCQ